ncbi:MAG: YidC/Oxa1 family insertase periplasmic-domain containing protein [Opitutales bacterium]
MDRTNFLIGIGLLILAFTLMFQQDPEPGGGAPVDDNASVAVGPARPAPAVPPIKLPGEPNATQSASITPKPDPITEVLSSELRLGADDPIEILFTNHGGAIREIRLKETDRVLKKYKFNYADDLPALNLAFEDLDGRKIKLDGYEHTAFEKLPDDNSSRVTWVNKAGEVEIRREYWRVSGDDPYLIHHRTTVTNRGKAQLDLNTVRLQVGTARPIKRIYNLFDDSRTYLNVGYYNAGADLDVGCRCANCSGRIDGVEDEFWQINEIGGTGSTFDQRLSQAKWACVSNRFFANVLRPAKEPRGAVVSARIIDFETEDGNVAQGISGSFAFPFGSIPPGGSLPVEVTYYAGPKDYTRLQALGHEQKTVMQFGVFWWVSEPLNSLLNMLRGWFGGFGSAIIVMTILVKLILWPLTAKSIRSQKKMQALQEPMQALKDRYKNNSQKLNQETMKFYKEHGVNPLAGCWPMLIQMPIFLGLFWMLRSAAELQGASFLWVDDLSEQDNVANFGSFSLNLLPVFMVATQIIQMKLTPMNLGPAASDQQRIQAKMMRMMPFFFLLFLYFFSSALVLYWTVQNILSITQTLVTKRGDTSPIPITPANEAQQKTKKLDPLQHISPEERDHRKALGLRLRGDLSTKEIKTAFKDRVARYHPDKIRNLGIKRQREAESKRKKLEDAREFLLKKD